MVDWGNWDNYLVNRDSHGGTGDLTLLVSRVLPRTSKMHTAMVHCTTYE